MYDRNIASDLGPRQLRRLTPGVVRTWHSGVSTKAGQDQAAKSYRLLRAVMATAEADELVQQNPCKIRGGGEEHAAERPLVATSLVLELAEVIDPRYRALVLLAGFGGLRTGESLGLRRCDVDALETHLSTFTGVELEAPVFTGPADTPLRRATLSAAWRSAVARAGAPEGLRLHDLRHHAATLTADAGGDDEGTHGPHRPRITPRGADLPARDSRAGQGRGVLSRRTDRGDGTGPAGPHRGPVLRHAWGCRGVGG